MVCVSTIGGIGARPNSIKADFLMEVGLLSFLAELPHILYARA